MSDIKPLFDELNNNFELFLEKFKIEIDKANHGEDNSVNKYQNFVKRLFKVCYEITSEFGEEEENPYYLKQKLKESEERHNLIMENANDLITIINKNFEFEYINEPTHKNLRGISNKDRIGKSILSIIHPEDQKTTLKTLKEGFITGEGKVEVRLINKDRTYEWFEIRGKTFIDNDGNTKALLITRNINERKLTEEALIKSEKKFRNIFESIPIGLHLYNLNPQGNLIFKGFNPAANKILNINCEYFINKTIEEAFPPLIKTNIPNRYKLLAKEGGEWRWDQVDYEKNQIKGAFEVVAFQTAPNTMVTSFKDITERIELENALRTSEEKFRLLFESIADPIHVVDADLKILYMNPAFERWLKSLGLDSNIVGKTPVEAWPFIGEEVNDEYHKVFETNQIHIKEDWALINDIDTFTEARKIPILKSGKVVQVITIIRDFSDRKKAEEKLKESEKKFKLLYENAPLEYQSLDSNGNILEVNKAWINFFGYSKEEVIGMWFGDFIDPEYLDYFNTRFPKFKETGEVHGAEFEIIKKDGSHAIVLLDGNISSDEKGNFKQSHCIFQDITERKKAELKLKESEEKFKLLFESIADPIHVIDADLKIMYINPAFERWLKSFNMDLNIVGKNPVEVWPFIGERVNDEYQKVFKTKQIHIKEDWAYADDRSTFTETRKIPILKSGKVVQVITIIRDFSDRKKAEQKLKESEEKYRKQNIFLSNILESLTHPFYVINTKDYTIALANSTASFKGLEYGQYCYRLTHDRDTPCVAPCKCPLEEVKKTKRACVVEHVHYDRKGNEKMYEIYGYPILDENGNVVQMIEYTLNITDRKRAQQELKKSEEKYRHLFENSPYYIILLDKEGFFIDCNNRTIDIFGYPKEDFLCKIFREMPIIPPELLPVMENIMELLFKGEMTPPIEFIPIRKDGKRIWINSQPSLIRLDNEFFIYIIGQDITERKEAEQQLKESEEKFRKIAEQSFMGIIIRQHDNIKYVNDAAINIFGYSMEDVKEWSNEYITEKCIYPEDLPYIRENRRTEREGSFEKKQYLSYRAITKSGKLRWIDQYSKIMLYQDEISELITIVDITEKKEAERLIIEENKKLLELDKMRRDFLIRASHELKTPLNSVYSTSEFLLHYSEEILDEKLKKFLEIIYKGGKRLKTLIENLLDVSRFESEKFELNLAEKDVRKIIDNCIKEVDYLSKSRNISINFEKSEDILINLDKIRMEQVFVNILVNAVKNTPNFGEVTIETLQKKDHLKIIFTDTGVGFTEEEKGKIFEKFGKIERYGQGMDIDTEGSGLGLFISKEIVELHGGKIWLESEGRNKGSTFIVSLPLDEM